MRSPSILLLLIPAIFLGLTTAVFTHKNSNLASIPKITGGDGEKRLLRGLAADQGENNAEEERALNLNFGFLKKLKVPGTDTLKATLAAKKAAAAAKKADRKAAKLKWANMFKLTGERDDQLFPKFGEWFNVKIKDVDVIEVLVAGGKTRKEAGAIASRYRDWKMIKVNKAPLP